MQSQKKRNERQLRQFKVGVVGASDQVLNSLNRVLTITQYRTRCYECIPLNKKKPSLKKTVDIVVVCSSNPTVVEYWQKARSHEGKADSPVVILLPPKSSFRGRYVIPSPVNPSRLIKLLDNFTIQELNYLPEFEIGHDSSDIQDMAFSGIKLLKDKYNGSSETSNRRRNALVVDDSLAVRRQMQLEFDLLDDNLDLAEDGEQALAAIQNKKYDVVFLDVVMPGIDGYTACKKIKKNPLNRDTPVILLTSKSSSFDKIKGTLAGCNAYLVKPINHNEFTQAYQQNVLNSQGAKHASQ